MAMVQIRDLDYWLGTISVSSYDDLDEGVKPHTVDGWYYVEDESGIVAYFSTETAALRYRLAEINRRLNG